VLSRDSEMTIGSRDDYRRKSCWYGDEHSLLERNPYTRSQVCSGGPPSAIQMETRWGRRFGRYEVVAEVGRGAMGGVYKARDPKIDRFVAVKTISLSGQNPEEEREYQQRFFHEAQAAGARTVEFHDRGKRELEQTPCSAPQSLILVDDDVAVRPMMKLTCLGQTQPVTHS
jgi:hypothetical protein